MLHIEIDLKRSANGMCICLQGSPYPKQDQNAIDAVMQFAIHKLGFQPEDIILFGWSIGGYSSLVAAAQYPDVKGVVCVVCHTCCLSFI